MEKLILKVSSGTYSDFSEYSFPITYHSKDDLEFDILSSESEFGGYDFLGCTFTNYTIYTFDEWFEKENLFKHG